MPSIVRSTVTLCFESSFSTRYAKMPSVFEMLSRRASFDDGVPGAAPPPPAPMALDALSRAPVGRVVRVWQVSARRHLVQLRRDSAGSARPAGDSQFLEVLVVL